MKRVIVMITLFIFVQSIEYKNLNNQGEIFTDEQLDQRTENISRQGGKVSGKAKGAEQYPERSRSADNSDAG